MINNFLFRALPVALAVVFGSTTLAFADTSAALPPTDAATTTWGAAYGFSINSSSDFWPMFELLHQYHFDWELYSLEQRSTPVEWAALPTGVYGQYVPSQNVVKLSFVLQSESTELATSFLAHELTHLTDDLNGKLGNMQGDVCYAAETRAFVNEANYWEMLNGTQGKASPDRLEQEENDKMFAFVGNSQFANLVLRTTASYVKQCGS